MSTETETETETGDYPYQNNIRAPNEIGMNDNGTIPQLGRNVKGLIEYVKLLVDEIHKKNNYIT